MDYVFCSKPIRRCRPHDTFNRLLQAMAIVYAFQVHASVAVCISRPKGRFLWSGCESIPARRASEYIPFEDSLACELAHFRVAFTCFSFQGNGVTNCAIAIRRVPSPARKAMAMGQLRSWERERVRAIVAQKLRPSPHPSPRNEFVRNQ
ncbi:MAG: hypothetical protein ACI9HK_003818 [Pirellulaceae bacterium]|jgi:hypothetical protein